MKKAKILLILCLLLSTSVSAQILSCLTTYDKNINTERIEKAYKFAKKAHKGQVRKLEKLPYISHPDRVAQKVYESTHDEDMIIAALLHDTLEDTSTRASEIKRRFGPKVASLVLELTTNQKSLEKLGKTLYLTQKLNMMSEKALTIKLYDRLDNLRDLKLASKEFQTKYTRQTYDIVENLNRKLNPLQKSIIAEINEIISPYIFQ